MNCPNCQETLLMTVRNNVEIDYCPKCRGIWLDRGELDKLLEQNNGISNKDNTSFRQHNQEKNYQESYRQEGYRGQDQRHHDSRYPKKKKSFLEDLFDF